MNELPNPVFPLSEVNFPRGSLHRPDPLAVPGPAMATTYAPLSD